ncbi:hypothetical protein [Chamaesiphon sp. OTE_20_metabat_361]|uniref:hypothetical protein n=1 Tax=Chamaesiphon sp. OTE_20_metabat_361 TaxID=2964689 RepID=UPI00286C35F7|nr:hypothetical protein [Chamaesiphon sp. OTE_20_metabat_361]
MSTNWYVHHQNQMEWYPSQEAALDAVDLCVASYENGIWSDKNSYLSLGHADGVTVDNSLFRHRYSPNALTPSCVSSIFTIDIFIKNKEDWIFKYGSDLLQQSLRAGYDCNDGYLAERLARDYPGFKINDRKYTKVDTPSARCLHACLEYEHAHCSAYQENYYITIDNYLGKHQLIKSIDNCTEIAPVELPVLDISDKADWILEHGSNLLQQSLMAGYNCHDRYLQERLVRDYPGFTIAPGKCKKVDSPSESCLYTCLGYEDSYCSSYNNNYYITIDGFLGKYQLIKLINTPNRGFDSPVDRAFRQRNMSIEAATNLFTDIDSMKLINSSSLINSVLTPMSSTKIVSISAISGALMYATIEYFPKIFQAIVSHI